MFDVNYTARRVNRLRKHISGDNASDETVRKVIKDVFVAEAEGRNYLPLPLEYDKYDEEFRSLGFTTSKKFSSTKGTIGYYISW